MTSNDETLSMTKKFPDEVTISYKVTAYMFQSTNFMPIDLLEMFYPKIFYLLILFRDKIFKIEND